MAFFVCYIGKDSILFWIYSLFLSSLLERYRVLGRVIHMDFVKEHLATKKNIRFGDIQEQPNQIELEILADTIQIKVRKPKKRSSFKSILGSVSNVV